MNGPCVWPVQSSAREWADADPDGKAVAAELATNILWALTGRVFGLCEVTVRPCFSPTDYSTYRGRSGSGATGSQAGVGFVDARFVRLR